MSSTLLYWPSWIGKSTIWALLAKKEWRKHIDTDKEFVHDNWSISAYINQHWLEAFRRKEWEILKKYLWTWDVVSLWWWTLLLPENQQLADSTGNVITLMTDVETLIARVLADTVDHRPLSQSEEMIRKLYHERYQHYTEQKIILTLGANETPEKVMQNIQRVQHNTRLLEVIY